MSLRIQVDGPVVVGIAARVTVTTFAPTSQRCADDPQSSHRVVGTWYMGGGAEPSDPVFRLIAHPADRPDSATDIPLAKRAKDSPYWDGTMTFPSAGEWTLRMAEPHWGQPYSEEERCAGARATIHVENPASDTPVTALLIGVSAAAICAAIALGFAVRRRRT